MSTRERSNPAQQMIEVAQAGAFANGAASPFTFACPLCHGMLHYQTPDELRCSTDAISFSRTNGIWQMMTPNRAAYFEPFIRDYETIRRAEGRGSDDSRYYRSLPFTDLTGRFDEDWRVRATSYRTLIRRVLLPLERRRLRPLNILDIGAGNCWLSHQLAGRGHDVMALDLVTNSRDGLGVHPHYDTQFTLVRAEFDRLPVSSGQFDLVVFNASIHYAPDYAVTLGEAIRVLRADGHIAIIDSPVYQDAASGETMVREREAEFVRRYGFSSNAIPSENYLTHDRLENLGDQLGLRWRVVEPFYGLGWALRPLRAKIRGKREPAKFMLIDGRRGVPGASLLRRLKTRLGRYWTDWRYRLSRRRRYNRLMVEQVAGRPLVVLAQVFNPKLLRTGEFLAGVLNDTLVPPGATVLDLGSGSGIGAVTAAEWTSRVVAVDINPEAVRCTRINALLNRIDEKIEAREGNLFGPVTGERFDVILFNPPYFRGAPAGLLDQAWRSEDVVERFADELAGHLTVSGHALVVLSSDGESRAFLDAFRMNGLVIDVVARRDLMNEVLTVYRLSVKG